MSHAEFRCEARCGEARAGQLRVRGKSLATPAFLPVGTYGAVKGVDPAQVAATGAGMLLANACHLHDRPGEEVIETLGGLHRCMGWNGLILTDSGGFQVFSMLDRARLDEDGVSFRSPVDGRPLRLGPREAVAIQRRLDSDVAMVFDDCPPLPATPERLRHSVERTTRWATLARQAHLADNPRGQAQFGIVQGGLDPELRRRSAAEICALGFDGHAVGGLSVGESRAELHASAAECAPLLPADRVRYLMGVGHPEDVLAAIAAGFDLFDCVLPTRNGRHGKVFTGAGSTNLRNASLRDEAGPIEADCDCPACLRFPVGALRNLLLAGDPLARSLCSLHNLRHLHRLVAAARESIVAGELPAFLAARRSSAVRGT